MGITKKIRRWWRRLMGQRVVTPEEIEGILRLPVLAVIPHMERRRIKVRTEQGSLRRRIDLDGRWRSRLLLEMPPDRSLAAAYETLLDQIQPTQTPSGRRAFLLASAVPGEGVSLSAANLAIVAARRSLRVLLIEGSTARTSRVFGLPISPGFTECLERALPVAQVIHPVLQARIDLLPCGAPAKHPDSIWMQASFRRVLSQVRSAYDLVLFDGPALTTLVSPADLGQCFDGLILIHQFGRTSAERLMPLLERLSSCRERILGAVLNDVPS
jgi:Mrp family chromosome partitioning ATPase